MEVSKLHRDVVEIKEVNAVMIGDRRIYLLLSPLLDAIPMRRLLYMYCSSIHLDI
jgi:hypothetical protein